MAAILNLAILDSAIWLFPLKLTHTCQDWFPPFPKKKKNFTYSSLFTICAKYFTHSIWLTWWWQPSWILPSWIQPFWTKLWLKLIQSDSNSFILTQLDDGSHLEFGHLGFSHFAQKKPLSFILTQLDDGSHLEFCQLEFHHHGFSHLRISSQTHSHLPRLVPTICTKKLHSFILTQLDDGSHLEFCHVEFRHMASWIQTPCYLFWDSLQNTLTPLWLWIKLIQSDINSFLLT